MVDALTIAFAVVIPVAFARWTHPVRSITAFFLALLTGAWMWANLRNSGWQEVWNFQTPARKGVSTAIYSAPLCTGDLVYFGSFDGHLYGLKADGGGLKWQYEPKANSEIDSAPVTDGRRVILSLRKNFEKQGFNGTVVVGEAEE